MSTDTAPPAFRFTRESRIRIDADGHVWHEGQRIEHTRLERGLASWVDFDDEARRYVLRNSLDWCWITVDRAPLVVRSVKVTADGVDAVLSDDSVERLRLDTVRVSPDGEVWAYARNGTLLARFDRSAAFGLLEHAELAPDGTPSLRFGSASVALAQLRDGEQLPPRPDGPMPVAAPSTRAAEGDTRDARR